MPKVFTYITRSFVKIWFMTIAVFLVLIGLFDSLAHGNDFIGNFSDTFVYMYFRAPVILDRIYIFAGFVALLVFYVKLIRQKELVALLGFGISVPRQIILLAPAVILTTLFAILFVNRFMPSSVRSLQAWNIGEYKSKAVSPDNPLWFADGDQLVRAAFRPNRQVLGDLEIFSREIDGRITDYISADLAQYDAVAQHWKLSGAKRLAILSADGRDITATPLDDPYIWETGQTPNSIARLAADARDLALSDLRTFSERGNSGAKPRFAYGYWHWHRLTRLLAALILLIVAVPMMQRVGRGDTGDKALLVGIFAGFVFLVFDGVLGTLATTGGMAIFPAISVPLVIFGLLGGYLCLKSESL